MDCHLDLSVSVLAAQRHFLDHPPWAVSPIASLLLCGTFLFSKFSDYVLLYFFVYILSPQDRQRALWLQQPRLFLFLISGSPPGYYLLWVRKRQPFQAGAQLGKWKALVCEEDTSSERWSLEPEHMAWWEKSRKVLPVSHSSPQLGTNSATGVTPPILLYSII